MQYKYQPSLEDILMDNKELKYYVVEELAVISCILGAGLRIDELVVMEGSSLVFELTKGNRPVDDNNLANLIEALHVERKKGEDPFIVELDEQPAEDFDLLIPVLIYGDDFSKPEKMYCVFGNYLAGTLKNLKRSPHWEEAKHRFFTFAEKLCHELEQGRETFS